MAKRPIRGMINRDTVILILGVAFLAVVLTAVLYRGSGFKISAGGPENRVEFDFQGDNKSLEAILDEMLNEAGPVVISVLAQHGFLRFPSRDLAERIRQLQIAEEKREVVDFAIAIRTMLYDLKGPFARPQTFREASDDRILDALDDLSDDSPIRATLWQMQLNWQGIFTPPPLTLLARESHSLSELEAAVCVGSVLLDKRLMISGPKGLVQVHVNQSRLGCNARKGTDLLAGEAEEIWVASGRLGLRNNEQSLRAYVYPNGVRPLLLPDGS